MVEDGTTEHVAAVAVQEDVRDVVVLTGSPRAGAATQDGGTGLRDALGRLGADDVRVGVFSHDAGPEVTDWVADADR